VGTDALGTITGTETASVTDDLTLTFSATPTLGTGGGVSWSGTGTVSDVTTATDRFNAYQSVAVAQTTVGGDDDGDYGDDDDDGGGYASTTIDSDVYTESETQTNHSSVQTDYQMTPTGSWRATETDAADNLTGSDMGSLHESLYNEYGSGTDDDWSVTNSDDESSQSGTYHETGSLHTTWGATGNPTVTGAYSGGSQQSGLWTYDEEDESADYPGADTTVQDDSQGYTFHDTWGAAYGAARTVSAENDGWQTGSVVTDDNGTLQPEQDTTSTPSDTYDYPHFYANGPGTPAPFAGGRLASDLTADSPGYPNTNYLTSAAIGTLQAVYAAAPSAPAAPPPAASVLGSATPTVIAPSVAAPVSTTPTAPPPASTDAPAGPGSSNTYTPEELNGGRFTNFVHELYTSNPTAFGGAENVTTPTSLKVAQTVGVIGLSASAGVATAGVAAAGLAALGVDALLTGVISGGIAAGTQEATAEALQGQPLSGAQIANSIDTGAALGGAGGIVLEAAAPLLKPVLGAVADAISGLIGNEATGATAVLATEGAAAEASGESSALLDQIRAAGGTVRVAGPISEEELALASRASGNEIAQYQDVTTGEYFVREGAKYTVPVPLGSKLLIHIQPGSSLLSVIPSAADRVALQLLGQETSVIVNSGYTFRMVFGVIRELDQEIEAISRL
jgi:hypothetical protein